MIEKFNQLPTSTACRLIEYTDIEVNPGIVNDSFFLVVSGTKPSSNVKVKLVPLVYIKQPEYWGIELVGCLSGIGTPSLEKYTVYIPLDGIRGTKGIEVIGANGTRKIDI
jgi:hypothetical protein